MTKNELLDAVWSDVEVTENVLSQCIKEARAALGDDVQNPHFLKTLPRLGYEFIGAVAESGEPKTPGVVEEELSAVRVVTTEEDDEADNSAPTGSRKVKILPTPATLLDRFIRSPILWVATLTLMLTAAALTLDFKGLRNKLAGRASSPVIRSLAVLPLENLTGNAQQEYFADGMTEELITNLGKLKALRVISRTSVMRYKKTNKPLPQIAKELNVDAVIEGAVLRDGNHVRITAQLIQGETDKHLWAESYDGDLQDILALQSQVASAIAREIRAEAEPQGQSGVASRRPVNPQAYALYLQGRVLWGRDSEPDNRAAIGALEHAVTIDPNFAPAYAALGRVCADRLFGWEPKDEWKEKAEGAIDKALSLDSNLAEAHVSRAALLFTSVEGWQYENAIQECRRALTLEPNLAVGHLTLGGLLFHIGLLDGALWELQTGASIDPTFADTPLAIGLALDAQGRFQEALPFLRQFQANAAFSQSVQA